MVSILRTDKMVTVSFMTLRMGLVMIYYLLKRNVCLVAVANLEVVSKWSLQ